MLINTSQDGRNVSENVLAFTSLAITLFSIHNTKKIKPQIFTLIPRPHVDRFLNMLLFVGGCQDIRQINFNPPEYSRYLEGHVILSFSIRKYQQCEERCLLESDCVSVNIGPLVNNKVVCELSNSDHMQHPEDLKGPLKYLVAPCIRQLRPRYERQSKPWCPVSGLGYVSECYD